MQKFIPADPFFNGGDSSKPLNGSDQEIANFYRFPKGYAFALRDTMEDIICHFSAALLSCSMIFFCCSKKNRTKTNSI
jgi:hypothetical protein